MSLDDDRLADAVNHEPIVFYDCTQSEMLGSVLAAAACGILSIVVISVVTGLFFVGLITGLIVTLGAGWAFMTWLKHIRQKYYTTWFKEKVFLWKNAFSEFLGAETGFVKYSKRFGKGVRRG